MQSSKILSKRKSWQIQIHDRAKLNLRDQPSSIQNSFSSDQQVNLQLGLTWHERGKGWQSNIKGYEVRLLLWGWSRNYVESFVSDIAPLGKRFQSYFRQD